MTKDELTCEQDLHARYRYLREQPQAVLKRLKQAAVDATTDLKVTLRLTGTPIGPNDTAIAAGAIERGRVCVGAGPGAGRQGKITR